MYDIKCTCPTTKSRIDELTKWSFCFRRFIHSFYEAAEGGVPTGAGRWARHSYDDDANARESRRKRRIRGGDRVNPCDSAATGARGAGRQREDGSDAFYEDRMLSVSWQSGSRRRGRAAYRPKPDAVIPSPGYVCAGAARRDASLYRQGRL